MIPAAAAIPLMTLRLSMLGKIPLWPARPHANESHTGPAVHPFKPPFDVKERDRPHGAFIRQKCGRRAHLHRVNQKVAEKD